MIKSFKLNIKGGEWNIRLLPNASYIRKNGSDSDAVVYLNTKTIYFNVNKINLGIIRHELLHAIIEESHTESSSMSADQVEEMCASILQTQWNNINLWTEFIINKVTELEAKDE